MKLGERSYLFKNPAHIVCGYTIVGPKEGEGNFGTEFDYVLTDDLWGEKSYELSECKIHRETIKGALKKAGMQDSELGLMLAGDLLNEIVASSFAAREFQSAFLGLYNACATFGEALLIGSMLISAGFVNNCSCSTSSHFSSAERQYRYPLELGTQRTPTSQWTVTGAGCTILSTVAPEGREFDVQITGGTMGRVVDMGVDDETNMGAAMAPAAADTLITHFRETGRAPSYYDAIYTGDLGKYGMKLVKYICEDEGMTLPPNYHDCGAMYYTDKQKTEQGGSGAGCSSTAFNAHILRKLQRGELKRVLLVPTGALLSRDTPLQKQTIPGIAHAVSIEVF
ncbi:MAG: stage V sporulation protein AD [Clostridiales bacterium]|nr:stage V sporulation protein AD [Clostridiales bacterium]